MHDTSEAGILSRFGCVSYFLSFRVNQWDDFSVKVLSRKRSPITNPNATTPIPAITRRYSAADGM
jgi:hypothetical protein